MIDHDLLSYSSTLVNMFRVIENIFLSTKLQVKVKYEQ